MTKIKICGVTREGDAAFVAASGADYIGLNFWPQSKRYLAPDLAPQVVDAARGAGLAKVVGVFVNAKLPAIVSVVTTLKLDMVQLHGDETPEDMLAIRHALRVPVWKAIAATGKITDLDRWRAEMILLDTPSAGRGGAGLPFDWALARTAREAFPAQDIMLAGGLGPENVGSAIAAVTPFAVDVATGVEAAPGVKDADKVTAFIAAVRSA